MPWMPSSCSSKLQHLSETKRWSKGWRSGLPKTSFLNCRGWEQDGHPAAAQGGASGSRISILLPLLKSSTGARVVLGGSEGSWAAGGPSSLGMFWPSLTHLCELCLSSTGSCAQSFNSSYPESGTSSVCQVRPGAWPIRKRNPERGRSGGPGLQGSTWNFFFILFKLCYCVLLEKNSEVKKNSLDCQVCLETQQT